MPNPNVGVAVNNKLSAANDEAKRGYVAGTYPTYHTNITNAVAYSMTPEQQCVHVNISVAVATALNLPSAAACAGRGLYIIYVTGAAGTSMAVTDPDGFATTRTLTTTADEWVGYSDGHRWRMIRGVVAGALV